MQHKSKTKTQRKALLNLFLPVFQPKNLTHREAVKKSVTVGLQVLGEQRTQTFPVEVIEEAIIISDLFDLNEYAALELLLAGKEHFILIPRISG
ncbi:hypothetical protein DPMN_127275 [Dreissena polymorpha]|uniref:Uncharacterized protein n=1 Tax=Dreissena polymorpha TaxID=45954 RepID=A0A9D4GYP0_DREPO|nr:hypothetical protein DPMN_127275 [Dreissena polymorpha]